MSEQQNMQQMAEATFAAIERMDEGIDTSHPEYQAIQNLKQAAEQAVIEGLRGALTIADAARNVRQAVAEVKVDAAAQAPQSDV